MSTTPEEPQGLGGMTTVASDAVDEVAPEMRLPSSILPLPTSMMSSFSSWWNLSPAQTAEAELFLVRRSGYFKGATVGNASECTDDGPDALSAAYRLVTGSAKEAQPLATGPAKFFTVGTQCESDGKVGCIRLVDIGAPPAGTSREGVLSRLGLRHHPRKINTLEIGTPVPRAEQDPHEQKVVLVHGYAAGLAFFYRNMQMFGSLPNSRFFALDWLGMGRSSRPPYALPHSKARSAERIEAAESYFLASLEQWREKMQIDKMVLVGHSLGGYLSVAYALRYPERVERLVLVSPVGIPEGSWHPGAAPERPAQDEAVSDDAASDCSDSSVQPPMPPRRLNTRTMSVLGWLWDRNVSIFSLLRSTSFFAPWLVSGYTRRRFANIPPEELQCMHAYCHGIFAGRGSSEYCCMSSCADPVSDILAPGAYARSPLIHRIGKLKMPTLFLYVGSVLCAARLTAGRQRLDGHPRRAGRAAAPARRRQHGLASGQDIQGRYVVRDSHTGHHLYLDNPRRFNEALTSFLLRRAP